MMKDFHPTIRGTITEILLTLVAVLFVDNTDQLHLAKDHQTKKDFIEQVQGPSSLSGG